MRRQGRRVELQIQLEEEIEKTNITDLQERLETVQIQEQDSDENELVDILEPLELNDPVYDNYGRVPEFSFGEPLETRSESSSPDYELEIV